MSPKRPHGFLAVFAMFFSFALAAEAQTEQDADEVVRLVAEAATCIFYPHFDAVTPSAMFDEKELEILENYEDQINVMIRIPGRRAHQGLHYTDRSRGSENH